ALRPAGHEVVGVDNIMRRVFFGPAGDTLWNLERLKSVRKRFTHAALDIRNRTAIEELFRTRAGGESGNAPGAVPTAMPTERSSAIAITWSLRRWLVATSPCPWTPNPTGRATVNTLPGSACCVACG